MRKLLLIAILLTVSISFGQQNETWVFSGELGFQNNNFKYTEGYSSEQETKQFNVIAKVGHLSTKTNFEIGLGFGYSSYQNESYSSNNNDTYITTTIVPYVKKYFPLNEQFAFHLIGEIGFSKTYLDSSSSSNEIDIQEHGIVVRPGFVYFLTKHIALTANIGSLGYITTISKHDDSYDSKTDSFGLNLNTNNLLFGISYYL
jgi:long-subunit fatty acid transport protein